MRYVHAASSLKREIRRLSKHSPCKRLQCIQSSGTCVESEACQQNTAMMQCSPSKLCCSQEAGGFQSILHVCVRPIVQHAAGLSSCLKHGSCRQQPPPLHSMVMQER